jgi:magnesium transporter
MQETKPTVEEVKQLLAGRSFKRLRATFRAMEAADLSDIFAELDIVQCIVLFRLIPKENRAGVFSYFPFELQQKMLDQLPDPVAVSLLNEMEPVDRTQLLEDLPAELSTRLILKLNPEERKIAWQLLSYPEDSVGRLMSPEFFSIRPGLSVRDVLADIRWTGNKIPEDLLNQIFIVDESGKLLGHVHLSSLVLADPSSILVDELMDPSVVKLKVSDDKSLAVDYFRKYDRPYIPVVDEDGVMVGLVEADDVFDVAEEEATEDIQAFGGQATLEDSYFQTSMMTLFRKRGGWLAMIFIMSMFSATALEHFSGAIKTMSFLVFFMPLIIASGGNSGSQAASLIIRGLAVREIGLRDWWKVLQREILIGLGLGALLGTLGFLRAFYLGNMDFPHGLIIGCTLVMVVICGVLVGSMLPFILNSLRLDPAVSSSPVISSLMDLFGIIVLFNIAVTVSRFVLPLP